MTCPDSVSLGSDLALMMSVSFGWYNASNVSVVVVAGR